MKPKKIYIGIDPSLRRLNVAIVDDQKKPLAVFLKRNDKFKDDIAVVNTATLACELVQDVIAWFTYYLPQLDEHCEIVTVVESQSMMHTKKMREKGEKINYESIRRLAQVTGCLMGAFARPSDRMYLVQAIEWKGTKPKDVSHERYYKHLSLDPVVGVVKNIFPLISPELCEWSSDKINPGDFWDINDSLGLALYGIKKGL